MARHLPDFLNGISNNRCNIAALKVFRLKTEG